MVRTQVLNMYGESSWINCWRLPINKVSDVLESSNHVPSWSRAGAGNNRYVAIGRIRPLSLCQCIVICRHSFYSWSYGTWFGKASNYSSMNTSQPTHIDSPLDRSGWKEGWYWNRIVHYPVTIWRSAVKCKLVKQLTAIDSSSSNYGHVGG